LAAGLKRKRDRCSGWGRGVRFADPTGRRTGGSHGTERGACSQRKRRRKGRREGRKRQGGKGKKFYDLARRTTFVRGFEEPKEGRKRKVVSGPIEWKKRIEKRGIDFALEWSSFASPKNVLGSPPGERKKESCA